MSKVIVRLIGGDRVTVEDVAAPELEDVGTLLRNMNNNTTTLVDNNTKARYVIPVRSILMVEIWP